MIYIKRAIEFALDVVVVADVSKLSCYGELNQMMHSRPQTVLVTATQVPIFLATQTGVTLSTSRLKRKKSWATRDFLKIIVPALIVACLVALKSHLAFGAEIGGVSITPPQGWQVTEGMAGASIVMQEPVPDMAALEKAAAKSGLEQTTFRRNITVATIQNPSPIDEQRATELKAELVTRFGQSGVVRDYQITEHKFFNYRGKNDGLLVYASLKLSDVPVMQMHILVSGTEKQYLLTYTDLAESISNANNHVFEAAWNSMVSIAVQGEAPKRFDEKKMALAGTAGGLVLLGIYFVIRMRRRNPLREADLMLAADAGAEEKSSDFMMGSSLATLPLIWDISGDGSAEDDGRFDMPAVSSISNY